MLEDKDDILKVLEQSVTTE